jgi:hypothetical protein
MAVLQAFIADGNELAFFAGSAAAFCKPIDGGIPYIFLFAVHDPLYVRFHVLVFMNRNGCFKITDIKEIGEIIFSAKLGVLTQR